MKKIIALLMGVGLALSVAGCSDDGDDSDDSNSETSNGSSGSSGGSGCNIAVGGTVYSCMTADQMTAEICTEGGGTAVDSCKGGALLTCDETGMTIYYYEQAMVDSMDGSCG